MNTSTAPRPFGTGVVIPVCTPLTRDDDVDLRLPCAVIWTI